MHTSHYEIPMEVIDTRGSKPRSINTDLRLSPPQARMHTTGPAVAIHINWIQVQRQLLLVLNWILQGLQFIYRWTRKSLAWLWRQEVQLKEQQLAWGKILLIGAGIYLIFHPGMPWSGKRQTQWAPGSSAAAALFPNVEDEAIGQFISRFAPVAQSEMRQFGIPASIKMAQALLESNTGASALARESNNYFGIKCRKECLDCTCKNYQDDSRFDMFRVFSTPWESWRAHSKLLTETRYAHLKQHGTDYKSWAQGLAQAGYATDPGYADKLVQIIDEYQLFLLDREPDGSHS